MADQLLCLEVEIEITVAQGTRTLRALVDSGARANFISQRVIIKEDIPATSKLARAHSIDGHTIRTYGRHMIKTYATDMRGTRQATDQEYIATDMVAYNVILGYPWLCDVEPDIRWGPSL
jgi:Retroviral aspartyl protease